MRDRLLVVMAGPASSGKTSLARRLGGVPASEVATQTPTIGVDFHTIMHPGYRPVRIWDTSGQDRFQSVCHLFYRQGTVVWICVRATDTTPHVVETWVTRVRRHNPGASVVVVVTRLDDTPDHENVRTLRDHAHRLKCRCVAVSALMTQTDLLRELRPTYESFLVPEVSDRCCWWCWW